MKNKCDKYEAYFIFGNEEKFDEHIKACEDCKQEQLKHQKVSSLIKEVSGVYLADKKKKAAQKLVSCTAVFVLLVSGIFAIQYNPFSQNIQYDVTNAQSSVLYELGCPVDDYGLLKI